MSVVTASLLREPPARDYEEEQMHRACVQFLRWAAPADCMWFHIPNGGKRSKVAAAKLVGLGTRAGIPDLCCIYRGRPIFIELKTPRGALSAVQKQVHQKLTLAGAEVFVCRSVETMAAVLAEVGVPLKAQLP